MNEQNELMLELNAEQIETVAGGYDDGDWCGTGRHPRIPTPKGPVLHI